MLQIDSSNDPPPAHQRDGKKGFITIFRQLMEELEARIESRPFGNRHWFVMFRHPTGNSLPHAQFEPVHHVRMSVLRCPQDQVLALDNIDQAGIAFHQSRGKLHYAIQHFVDSAGFR
jgi:hypothetical protein